MAPKNVDSIYVVLDRFSKITHFIRCKKASDASCVNQLLFRDIIRIHGMLKSITSDQDIKFIIYFRKPVWMKFGTKLQHSNAYHP